MGSFVGRAVRWRIADAIQAGAVTALATFAMFWVVNLVRVNRFLDTLHEWAGWQTVVARYRASGFESFRAFTNYDYLEDAPLKMASATLATLALVGGLAGLVSATSARQQVRRPDC